VSKQTPGKQRLGKGLGALIPEFKNELIDVKEKGVTEIPLEKLAPNPQQPRKDFSEEKLAEMANTIKAYGVIQPVLVHKEKEQYILVAGERRYKAAQMAGLKTIPAIVKEYSPKELIEIALVENLQREDLNPIEEASAYKRLLEEFNFSQEELARKIGRSRSSIANAMRLLTLDEETKKYLSDGKLTPGQVRPLLSISNPEQRRYLAMKILNNKLTARQVENMVKNLKREAKGEEMPDKENSKENEIKLLFLKEVEEKIRKTYGTKVKIKRDKKEGKIELYFYSDEDFERLTEILLKEPES
jgi:ParB family chromosome partitioning protein